MRKIITTYLGKEVNEYQLTEIFKKWADESLPVEMFQALHRNARHEDSYIAETARWQLFAFSDYTLNIVDVEEAAA